MTIDILGLGESLQDYINKPYDGNKTIGVNDIHSYVETDFVVCVDAPRAFKGHRLSTILETHCDGFFSQCEEWKHLPNFQLMEFAPGRGFVDALDTDKFNYAQSSPFVAVVLAYKMGAKNIVLYGVDFNTHKVFVDTKREVELENFRKLSVALQERGVTLYVGSSKSALSQFLPIWTDKEQG